MNIVNHHPAIEGQQELMPAVRHEASAAQYHGRSGLINIDKKDDV